MLEREVSVGQWWRQIYIINNRKEQSSNEEESRDLIYCISGRHTVQKTKTGKTDTHEIKSDKRWRANCATIIKMFTTEFSSVLKQSLS